MTSSSVLAPRCRLLFGLGSLAVAVLVLSAPAAAARPWLGMTLGDDAGGVKITGVLPTSPAARAGLKKGDVVLSVNGAAVAKATALLAITGKAAIGSRITLKFNRAGGVMSARVKVAARPPLAKLLRLYWLNKRSPSFSAPLVNKAQTVSLSSLRGKVVLLYFWATWCDSCKLNMSKLKKLHAAYASRGVVIYSLNQDKRKTTAAKTTAFLGLPFLVGHNLRNRIGLRFKTTNIPTLIAIDKRGIIRDYVQGSSWGYGSLVRMVKGLL